MARHIEDEVKYYYDSHPTEEDLMGETSFHSNLVIYLMEVLRWLFHGRLCAIYDNLNFTRRAIRKNIPSPRILRLSEAFLSNLPPVGAWAREVPRPRSSSRSAPKRPGGKT